MEFRLYISGRLRLSGCLACCISDDWCDEAQCSGALHILHFSVPIYIWSAWLLIHINCKLGARIFHKELVLLGFTKISFALCSRTCFLDMKEGNIPTSHEGCWRPLFKLDLELKTEKSGLKTMAESKSWKASSIHIHKTLWYQTTCCLELVSSELNYAFYSYPIHTIKIIWM